jgi:hypothetical protein
LKEVAVKASNYMSHNIVIKPNEKRELVDQGSWENMDPRKLRGEDVN